MSWRQSAACRDEDPELFYATKDEDIALAKTVCAACPVRAVCLERALVEEGDVIVRMRFGVRGGTLPAERARFRRARRADTGHVDDAAVLRRIAGDKTVTITARERIAVFDHLRARGWTHVQIEQHAGVWSTQVRRDIKALGMERASA